MARQTIGMWLARKRRASVRLTLDEMTALLSATEFTAQRASRGSLRDLHPHLGRATQRLQAGIAARNRAVLRAARSW